MSKLIIVISLIALSVTPALADSIGDPREEITDVLTNKQVQDLGQFAVQEYNRKQQAIPRNSLRGTTGGRSVVFVAVKKAKRQVVSGLKYYLQITATQDGFQRTFDAEVIEVPWKHSKQLLKFVPSPY